MKTCWKQGAKQVPWEKKLKEGLHLSLLSKYLLKLKKSWSAGLVSLMQVPVRSGEEIVKIRPRKFIRKYLSNLLKEAIVMFKKSWSIEN